MTQQGDAVAGELATEKVGIKGYLAFFLTIIFFSGVSGDLFWDRSERVRTPPPHFAARVARGLKMAFSLRWSWHRQSFSLWGLFQLPMVLVDYAPRSS
ncbi:hypothetical protein ECZU29_09080 [Escherichia coli]|nr:hypothetical protein ECZU29_09080 [Escherichia coli]